MHQYTMPKPGCDWLFSLIKFYQKTATFIHFEIICGGFYSTWLNNCIKGHMIC